MEKKQNFSRKREAILEVLKSTKTHPTAEWIFQQLKSVYPDLSLGTVYRNLSRFKKDGTIITVGVVNGQERFDADISPHSHFVCIRCGAVQDVTGEFLSPEVDRRISGLLCAQVSSHQVLFRGLCAACLAGKKTEKGA
ncbi:MAG: transcriptional repressor [Oscillospiraceae bacterium]|jgi:Fur family peroxide stress response transcriptional regulator|nr:transcriptional repressor [Oscillospiraceae bacterium]MDD3261998.1 transcriptional repressor [Oscillospiraceae bacterium]